VETYCSLYIGMLPINSVHIHIIRKWRNKLGWRTEGRLADKRVQWCGVPRTVVGIVWQLSKALGIYYWCLLETMRIFECPTTEMLGSNLVRVIGYTDWVFVVYLIPSTHSPLLYLNEAIIVSFQVLNRHTVWRCMGWVSKGVVHD
jgi:hypothetical protein